MHRSFWALVATAIVLAGCDGGGSATPTATPMPTVAPTEPAETSAHLVYLQDGNLWIADADGQNATQLSSDGHAGFAGLGLTPEGDPALYYTVMEQTTRQFTMYRALPGATAQEVFSFQGNDKNTEFSSGNASVSPAGDLIAFVDEDGLALYFTNIGNTRRLLSNVLCTDQTGTGCHGYFFPTWSPEGGELSALKIFFDGSRLVIVDQGSEPATERELEYGSYLGSAAWSIDGTRLCLPENSYAGGPALVVDVASGDATPVFADAATQAASRLVDCDWSSGGKLAVAYTVPNETAASPIKVAIIDADGASLQDIVPSPDATQNATVRWLDDESMVVDYVDAPTQIVKLDGTAEPLGADIGDLVAVVEY